MPAAGYGRRWISSERRRPVSICRVINAAWEPRSKVIARVTRSPRVVRVIKAVVPPRLHPLGRQASEAIGRYNRRTTPLEDLARRRLGEGVEFTGHVAAPHEYMARAAVQVVPSWVEAFGVVIIEGMRAGAPIIATTCDHGPKEIITDGQNGLLVPPRAPDALARAITRVLGDPDLAVRLRAAGAATSAAYTPERMISAYQDLFLKVASRQPAASR